MTRLLFRLTVTETEGTTRDTLISLLSLVLQGIKNLNIAA